MLKLPLQGTSSEEVLERMKELRERDANWRAGRIWSLVYHAGDQVAEPVKDAYTMFFSENGLNPMAFPSLKTFEAEVVAATGALLGGDEQNAGSMTSGGTESILMAVKTAREWAKVSEPAATAPEMILPATVHPAFKKAAHYFGVKPVQIPVLPDYLANVEATRAAVTSNTILIVGSASSWPWLRR